ncbi:MAG: FtsX-like permease family protein [Phycisphaeraceae bacterium]|nr:MAG: FtsX-like permease family protein [Phycisphaeraceae bacterium]
MRAAWRLATSNVFGRRSRTLLLTAVVTLSAALISAVATAMASVEGSLRARMEQMVGVADATLSAPARGEPFDGAVLERVRSWPEVDFAAPRLEEPVTLRAVRPVWDAQPPHGRAVRVFSSTASGLSVDAGAERVMAPITLLEGRLPRARGEVVVSEVLLARLRGDEGPQGVRSTAMTRLTSRLSGLGVAGLPVDVDPGPERAGSGAEAVALTAARRVGVGSTIEAVRLPAAPVTLTIVGVAKSELLGGRAQAYTTLDTLGAIIAKRGRLSGVDLVLGRGVDADAFVAVRSAELADDPATRGLILQTTERVTSGFRQNLATNRVPLLVASVMAFLSAAFIITTGMTVNITERRRELAILRCVGASRGQVAGAQVIVGLLIGTAGAAVGAPLGMWLAVAVLEHYQGLLKIEVAHPASAMALAAVGAVASGLVGALWPAWRAAGLSPLRSLAARAEPPGRRGITLALIAAGAGIALNVLSVRLGGTVDGVVMRYLTLGLPGLFLGYFLLGVPLVWAIGRVLGPWLARASGVPPSLLVRSVGATPYRMGLTSGAMMTGLALMVAIWTQGRAVIEQWLDEIRFPEVFVTGTNLTPEHRATIDRLPFVTETVGISPHSVATDAFDQGVFAAGRTTFIGFDPGPFFRLARMKWVQGDEATAVSRLGAGGAVIVAREFLTARGLGVGKTIRLEGEGGSHEFEIVGVVTSPGLDVVNQYFDLGQSFVDTAIHSVFGSREDLRDKLLGGTEPAVRLIQVGLVPEDDPRSVPDDEAERRIREELADAGVLDLGNGRRLKSDLTAMIRRFLMVTSAIAVMSMAVAGLGVANLIVAGIEARRFEFGVLRAVGATRGAVLRLVMAEAMVVALGAVVLGTLMGLQAVWVGQKIDAMLLGIELTVRPPWGAIAWGWAAVVGMTLGAAAPAVVVLSRRTPRELLASVRG